MQVVSSKFGHTRALHWVPSNTWKKTNDMKKHILYEHIYGNVHEQKQIAQHYIYILKFWEDLLQDQGLVDKLEDQEEDDINCSPAANNYAKLINYEIWI